MFFVLLAIENKFSQNFLITAELISDVHRALFTESDDGDIYIYTATYEVIKLLMPCQPIIANYLFNNIIFKYSSLIVIITTFTIF